MTNNQIAVHGLGYVGLTCAVHFARAGKRVIGYDLDPAVVQALNEGKPKAGEFLGYLGGASYEYETLDATTNIVDTLDAPVHVIAVPTEKRGVPHDDIVFAVLDFLWPNVRPGTLIIVESTLTPGTIDKFLAKVESPRKLGVDFHLAVCPRRDWFADPTKNLETLPRVIGGYTPTCTQRAADVLKAVSPTQLLTTYKIAEVTKALENHLLHVQVATIFELAMSLPEIDIAEAVRLATTHWRLSPLHLNFGTGGRCVPLGTQYLVEADKHQNFTLGHEVMRVEREMRGLIASAALWWKQPEWRPTPKAAVLGIAYRPEFKDMGLSPGLDVAKHLATKWFDTGVHDPLWTYDELAIVCGSVRSEQIPHPLELHEALDADVVLLATPHKAYSLLPPQYKWRKGQVVIDAQGAWENYRHYFNTNGVVYVKVGQAGWLGPHFGGVQ